MKRMLNGRSAPIANRAGERSLGLAGRILRAAARPAALLLLLAGPVMATPSTVFWTPATPYVQPFGMPHLTYDSYFNSTADFPTDVGLEIGVLPFEKLQAEIGFDIFQPGIYPLQLNAKIGTPEGLLFEGAPGWSLGVFGVGTKADVNDYNILHLDFGKTFEGLGSFGVGGYFGNDKLLVDGDGNADNAGLMASYYRTLDPLTDKIGVTADWQSGNNVFGAGGAGLYFWPVPNVDVIVGWVWFNDLAVNPYKNGMFTIQVDVDFDLTPSTSDTSTNAP